MHRATRICLATVLTLAAFILLGVSLSSIIGAEKTPPSRSMVQSTRVSLQVINHCSQNHWFRVSSNLNDPKFKQQTDAIQVDANATKTIEVLLDLVDLRGDVGARVRCLDCKKEEGCDQPESPVPIQAASMTSVSNVRAADLAMSDSSVTRQSGPTDVGIIPEAGTGCPLGSEHVIISMDDEDDTVGSNHSSVTGWTGEISHYSTGTTFGFCRVDGTRFRNLANGSFAVLQLGTACPSGSVSIQRVFTNEVNNNHNWSSGNISPSAQQGKETAMNFCYFPQGNTPTMSSFPNFYVPYGVFGVLPPNLHIADGTVVTDDEDQVHDDQLCFYVSGFASRYCSKNCSSPCFIPQVVLDFANIVSGSDNKVLGPNTIIAVTKASNGAPCTNPCPSIGTYVGGFGSCWVGQAPAGTHAFIWGGNFYYTPRSGNQCPRPGSTFDSKNCFVQSIPPQADAFVYGDPHGDMWFLDAVCAGNDNTPHAPAPADYNTVKDCKTAIQSWWNKLDPAHKAVLASYRENLSKLCESINASGHGH